MKNLFSFDNKLLLLYGGVSLLIVGTFSNPSFAYYDVFHGLEGKHFQFDPDVTVELDSSARAFSQSFWPRLSNLAKQKFAQAKIDVALLHDTLPLPKGDLYLKLVIQTINLNKENGVSDLILGERCSSSKDIWLMNHRIELWEWVNSDQNPNKPIWAMVWSGSLPFPYIKKSVRFEDIEKIFNDALDSFIYEYQAANPIASPPLPNEEKGIMH